MDPITTGAITKAAKNAVEVIAKDSKEVKKTFDDIWYLTFGRLGLTADKLRLKHQHDLNLFKESLHKEIEAIPEENLQEPKISIVGPALEASRFYIEEKELREMFVKVVSASFDKSKANQIHHSFVDIIKQLTPDEAKILPLFNKDKAFPIIRYEVQNGIDATDLNFLIFKGLLEDIVTGDEYAIEISNLERLNILKPNTEYQLHNNPIYSFYEQTTLHNQLKSDFDSKLRTVKGLLELTPYGERFIEVCI